MLMLKKCWSTVLRSFHDLTAFSAFFLLCFSRWGAGYGGDVDGVVSTLCSGE